VPHANSWAGAAPTPLRRRFSTRGDINFRSTFPVGKSNRPLHFGTSQPRKRARRGDCGGAGGGGDNGGGEGPAPGRDPRADGGPVAAAPRAGRPLRGRAPGTCRAAAPPAQIGGIGSPAGVGCSPGLGFRSIGSSCGLTVAVDCACRASTSRSRTSGGSSSPGSQGALVRAEFNPSLVLV
jgi:hypothetical protein